LITNKNKRSMGNIDEIKTELIDLQDGTITIDECANRILRLFSTKERIITKKLGRPKKCTHRDSNGDFTIDHSNWGEPFCSQCGENTKN
jgi:hypothetical protein